MCRNQVSVEEELVMRKIQKFPSVDVVDDAITLNTMKQKAWKYTDHNIQNEILQILALQHLHMIANEIRNSGYLC